MGDDALIDLPESVALLHAVVDRTARDVGARVLFIKGPVLTKQGLCQPHTSVDVDVLVEPGGIDAVLERLSLLGWSVPVQRTAAFVMPLHSSTLQHESWGCEIDVHREFPGFLSQASDVFEALWERRTTMQIAHRDLPCPDVPAHSVVAALHWLRDGWSETTREKLDFLVSALEPRLDETLRSELADFVRRTGATEPLRPFVERLGLDLPATEHDTTLWRIRTASTGVKSVGWVLELRNTSLRHLPERLWHALMLTEAEIRYEQPDTPPGPWGLFHARIRRLRSGLRDLPNAVRIVWRERRRR